MPAAAPVGPLATEGDGLGRLVIVNWEPEAVGLVRALQELGARELVCVGTAAAATAEVALADARGPVRYVAASVGDGVEAFAARLADDVAVAAAQCVIVLPHHGGGEPDAFSRITCAAIHRACRGRPPRVLVAVEDPEATHEFAGLGVATIFYPGFLRAALLAHACLDLAAFRVLLGLVRGRLRVQTWPVPAALQGRTFRDACLEVEADAAGDPITVLGLFTGPGDAPSMVVNPGPARPLADAVALLVLTGQDA
ncbi:MAG: hypothetical protein JNL82_31760 [Myxococcales bacterium]|nr:hypothetical protein [Myxococcales bacterium]